MALNLGLSVGETFGKAKVIGKPGIRVGGGYTNENSTSTNSQTNSTLSSLPKLENRLEEKAKRGDPRSQYELAMQLMEKPGQIKRVHDLLRSAAEKNHTKAMYQYALILATHKSKQKKAAEYMQIAASRNCPEANIALAIMLERGQGIEQNIKEALKIFKSYTKDPLALYHAGIIISQTDPKKGSAYFQRAAEKGHVLSMTEYGLYLKSQKKYKEAFEYKKKAAEAKEPRALYFYALACKDSPEFPTLLNRAMNNGSVEARLYYAREIESKDLGHALSIYKDLADDGNTIAQNEFGIHLMRFNRNNDAMMYFQKAIDGGSIKARFNMATIQLRLDPSSEDGIENLKIAADHGIAQAQYNYALFLERNEPENTHEIKKYYKKCSDQHLPNGMCNYASILFKEGKKSEAKKLFYEAARNGHAVAQYRYAKILEGENKIDEAMYYMELSSKKYPKAAYEYGLHLNSMGSREKSSMYLKEAADWGITGSQVIYGQITSDPEESVKYFKMAADKENPDGIYLLGKSLNDTKLIEKAAKMKHPQAMYDLALIQKDHTLMEKAAQEGNPDAIIYIGNELEQENIDKAIQFYRSLPFVPESMYRLSVITNDNELLHKAASMENKNALFYLYNQTEDQKYLKAAAENGHHRAMYLYSQTLPAEQDEYRRQFLVEASKTEPDALFLLGVEDEDDNKIKQSAE